MQYKRQKDLENITSTGFLNIEDTIEGCECTKKEDDDKEYFSDYFCADCLKWVCSKCKNDKKNPHYIHRVLKSRHLIKMIKENVKSVFLQYKKLENFEEKWEELSNKFQGVVQEFNKTIKEIDKLIKSIESLKKTIISQYVAEIKNHVKTFKIIKLFYMNYYTDKKEEIDKKNVETNNLFKLKYLANISYEFTGFDLSYLNNYHNEIENLKKEVNKLMSKKIQLLKGVYKYDKLEKRYRLDDVLTAHEKFITSLSLLDNKIISGSLDYYIKIWDNETGKYSVQKKIKSKQIGNLLVLKNEKFVVSTKQANDIIVYEKKEDGNFGISQSLSQHSDLITSLALLQDGKLVSGSKDNLIIIWEENPKLRQFMTKQIINTTTPILSITILNDFKIGFTYGENKSIRIMADVKTELVDYKMILKAYNDDVSKFIDLENHKGKVNCVCLLNNGYLASGGADFNKLIIDHDIYIWKLDKEKYIKSQVINAHNSDINSIILLRDGRFASASKDRSIKIWGIKKPIIDTKIEYIINQEVNDYQHGLYKLIQLNDDSLIATSSDNSIAIFRNAGSII